MKVSVLTVGILSFFLSFPKQYTEQFVYDLGYCKSSRDDSNVGVDEPRLYTNAPAFSINNQVLWKIINPTTYPSILIL